MTLLDPSTEKKKKILFYAKRFIKCRGRDFISNYSLYMNSYVLIVSFQ